MKKLSLILTIVSYALGGIAWLLGLMTVVFNVCGLWGPWHLSGFAFIFYCFIPVVPHIASFVVSFFTGNKKGKYITLNAISSGLTLFWIFFTVFISSNWFYDYI